MGVVMLALDIVDKDSLRVIVLGITTDGHWYGATQNLDNQILQVGTFSDGYLGKDQGWDKKAKGQLMTGYEVNGNNIRKITKFRTSDDRLTELDEEHKHVLKMVSPYLVL